MADWSKSVYPHGELTQLDERLWSVVGSLPRLPLPRNMFVYKLDDGGLLIFSAVAMAERKMQQLEALGPPRIILVPNHFHRLQARVYLERYPEARVVCPAASRDHVAKAVSVHGTAEEVLPKHGVVYHQAGGLKSTEGVYELPLQGGAALLFADALFNVPHQRGFGGFMMKLIGSTGFFGVTRIGRMFVLTKRPEFAAWLGQQAQRSDLKLIGLGHGDTITERCAERLREAAERL